MSTEEEVLLNQIASNFRDRADKLHERYRNSGLALMATVITLSGGGIYSLVKAPSQGRFGLLFIIPIIMAVIQQSLHYLGQLCEARASYSLFEGSLAVQQKQPVTVHTERASWYLKLAPKFFGAADWAGILAPMVLIGLSILWTLRQLCY